MYLFPLVVAAASLSQTSREQLAVAEFAQALLVIPKTLAVNAALDSTDLIAKLRAFHNASQSMSERESLKWCVMRGCGFIITWIPSVREYNIVLETL